MYRANINNLEPIDTNNHMRYYNNRYGTTNPENKYIRARKI